MVPLLLILNIFFTSCSSASIVNFEQVNADVEHFMQDWNWEYLL